MHMRDQVCIIHTNYTLQFTVYITYNTNTLYLYILYDIPVVYKYKLKKRQPVLRNNNRDGLERFSLIVLCLILM